ncbi:MAG: 3D domain-containing protein [Phycisphaerae bacterium]|nr:3D domain-containing protein [Phycisphaerae bacterium]
MLIVGAFAHSGTIPSPAAAPKTARLAADAPVPRELPSLQPVRTVRMRVTAYCACERCCGPNACGITASGARISADGGRFVAADTSVLPFNTRVIVPGYAGDIPVRVLDTGGAIRGRRLDVYFRSHRAAQAWGVRNVDVQILP